MDNEPKVGDFWIGEADDGSPLVRTVTAVVPPVTDPSDSRFPCDWQVALDGDGPAHLGWWWGQGWSKLESDEGPSTWVLGTHRWPERVFPAAQRSYFPDAGYPTHVLIWSGSDVTVVPYRTIEFLYERRA